MQAIFQSGNPERARSDRRVRSRGFARIGGTHIGDDHGAGCTRHAGSKACGVQEERCWPHGGGSAIRCAMGESTSRALSPGIRAPSHGSRPRFARSTAGSRGRSAEKPVDHWNIAVCFGRHGCGKSVITPLNPGYRRNRSSIVAGDYFDRADLCHELRCPQKPLAAA